MTARVSVILPVFNGEEFVSNAIESMLKQTYQDYELIIVDDGSTDETISIINKLKNDKISVFSIAHGGVAKAANFALRQCEGEYIARMDADDWSSPERLERQVNFFEKYPSVDVVSCRVKYLGINENAKGFEKYVDWTNELLTHNAIVNHRFVDAPIVNPSTMFKKELITKYGYYSEENIPEDYEMWLRWMANDVVFGKLDEVLFTWKDRESRLTRTHENYYESAFSKVKSIYFKKWYQSNAHVKKIYIWGHGSKMRKRSKFLTDNGIEIAGYIDIQDRNTVGSIYYKQVEVYKNDIVLGFVADGKGKKEISEFLGKNEMTEGVNFFHFV